MFVQELVGKKFVHEMIEKMFVCYTSARLTIYIYIYTNDYFNKVLKKVIFWAHLLSCRAEIEWRGASTINTTCGQFNSEM